MEVMDEQEQTPRIVTPEEHQEEKTETGIVREDGTVGPNPAPPLEEQGIKKTATL